MKEKILVNMCLCKAVITWSCKDWWRRTNKTSCSRFQCLLDLRSRKRVCENIKMVECKAVCFTILDWSFLFNRTSHLQRQTRSLERLLSAIFNGSRVSASSMMGHFRGKKLSDKLMKERYFNTGDFLYFASLLN